MLDEFGAEIEHADSRVDATLRKVAKVLHLSDGNIWFWNFLPISDFVYIVLNLVLSVS